MLFNFANAFGQHYNQTYGQPVVVLIETDPWLMVIGYDVPSFTIYENGQIIFRKIVNRRYKYFEIKNDTGKTQGIIKFLGITDNLMKQTDYSSTASHTTTLVYLATHL